MNSSRTKLALALACALAGLLTFAGSASAIIASSQITTPAGPAALVEPGTSTTVSGTASSTLTEVNIVCYYGSNPIVGAKTLAKKVLVTAEHFSTTVNFSSLTGGVCQLRAVPPTETSPLPPGEKESYEGPLVESSYYLPEERGNFELQSVSNPFAMEFEDVGEYGLESTAFLQSLHENVYVFYGVATLRPGPDESEHRASLQVNGVDAYAPAAAEAVAPKASGLPSVTVRHSIDPTTHQAVLVEEDPIVKCVPGGAFPQTEENGECTSFASTNVALVREWRTASEDELATLTDTWRSTNGESHNLSIRYYTEMHGAKGGGSYLFPGEGAYAKTVSATTKALPAGPGAILYKWNAAAPEAEDPQAAILYDSAPSEPVTVLKGSEGNEVSVGELPYVRTVTPSTPAVLRFGFAQSMSGSRLGLLEAGVLSSFPPSVAITSPANGSSTASPAIVVTGTAADGGALSALTVDGAAVPVGPGGAWTTAVALKPGANTITATATDQAGLSRSAAVTVTYVPPPVPAAVASVKSFKAGKGKVTIGVKCTGAAGTSCNLLATLTTVEKLSHGKLRSLAAKLRSKTVTVGSQKLTLAAGKSATLTISLNATGRRLLARFHRLPLKALVQLIEASGKKKSVSSSTLTLTSPRKKKKKHH